MTTIRQSDFVQSVADALQYISYFHPVDYIKNLAQAYEREESPAAKDAISHRGAAFRALAQLLPRLLVG